LPMIVSDEDYSRSTLWGLNYKSPFSLCAHKKCKTDRTSVI